MESAIERRTAGVPRVPLDVLIELSHDDFEEAFEADGVNLGLGGLSMRAAFLPEVGSRLNFRFCTQEGRSVESAGEVVWAHDSGPCVGEFGLRFCNVDPHVNDVIRDLVHAWHDATDPDLASDSGDALGTSVTLFLDGVATPITAEVRRFEHGVTEVEQELPFLRLGTPLVEGREGTRGYLESIDLRMDDRTPRLVLGIAWEPRVVTRPSLIEVPYFANSKKPASLPAPRADETLADESLPALLADNEACSTSMHPVEARIEEPQVDPSSSSLLSESKPRSSQSDVLSEDDVEAIASMKSGGGTVASIVRRAQRRFRPLQQKATVAIRGGASRVGPALRVAAEWIKVAIATLAAKSKPLTLAVLRWVTNGMHRMLATLRQLRKPRGRRRRTAPAPRPVQVVRQTRRRAGRREALPKNRRRGVVLGLLGVLGITLGVYALVPESEETADTVAVPALVPPSVTEGSTPRAPQSGAVYLGDARGRVPNPPTPAEMNAAPTRSPEPGADSPPPIQPAMPAAMPEPHREAGLMPPPSFPDVSRPPDPATVPENSPYAVDTRSENVSGRRQEPSSLERTRSFGANAVDNPRVYRLRMSQPIQSIVGERLSNGFKVTIPGALSLDLAGPIASSHDRVGSSSIINRGDHSVLTIEFASGQSPAYRVASQGRMLEIQIAR